MLWQGAMGSECSCGEGFPGRSAKGPSRRSRRGAAGMAQDHYVLDNTTLSRVKSANPRPLRRRKARARELQAASNAGRFGSPPEIHSYLGFSDISLVVNRPAVNNQLFTPPPRLRTNVLARYLRIHRAPGVTPMRGPGKPHL